MISIKSNLSWGYKLVFGITMFVICVGTMVSCQEITIEVINHDNTLQNKQLLLSGEIVSETETPTLYDGCELLCAGGITEIFDGVFQVNSYVNDNVQTFAVTDDSDNVYLLSRMYVDQESNIRIDSYTTAVALVTLHPLFAPVKSDEYDEVVNIITSSSKFENLHNEVKNTVVRRQDIFDVDNEALLLALNDLMEDISDETNNENFSGSLDDIVPESTRAIYDNPTVYPFHVDISGNVLTIRNVGLTPSYYGYVSEASGAQTPFSVPSRFDYGGMDLFAENVDEFMLGDPRTFRFTNQGQYKFHLSRMNASATADFYLRLANSILTSLGLSVGNDALQEVGNAVSRAMINAGSGVNDALSDPMDWVGIAYGAVVEWMVQDYWEAVGKGGIVKLGKVLSNSLNLYDKLKGVFNASLRLAHALSAPEEVNFCLCYYDGEISTCSVARLYEVSGNNQEGYSSQRLLLPLVVQVETLGDDGVYRDANTYHRIKFEVISGGGSVEDTLVSADNNNQASTYWTLGDDGDQEVKVTVVDIVTEKEISNPIYFVADVSSAQVTIRLDWSKHSCATDIDLHVVDPYGEEIAYYNMSSSSGGYLDRDDIYGPGPEHIRWSDAPVGTYKIYVHYYPNEAEDRSVTSYKVTVNADGVAYQPKTGSIAYDQFVPVGQFTIGESSSTYPMSFRALDETEVVKDYLFPAKK